MRFEISIINGLHWILSDVTDKTTSEALLSEAEA